MNYKNQLGLSSLENEWLMGAFLGLYFILLSIDL